MSNNNSIDGRLFDSWNDKKQNIHFGKKKGVFVHPGEIWYIHIGINIGYESFGKGEDFKRPVLIIKKIGNMALCVSMTTKGKNNIFYRKIDHKYFKKDSFLVVSQVKSIDTKRCIEKIGTLDKKEFFEIKKELQTLWF